MVEAVAATARLAIEKDRLQAELRTRLDELQRERDFIRTAIDTAPALFAVVDLEGRIVRFNDTWTEITGFADTDEIRGRTFWDAFIDPGEAGDVRSAIAAAAAGGAPSERENTVVTRTGERLHPQLVSDAAARCGGQAPAARHRHGRDRAAAAGADHRARARLPEHDRQRDRRASWSWWPRTASSPGTAERGGAERASGTPTRRCACGTSSTP